MFTMFRRVAINPVIAVTGLLAVALGLAGFAAPRAVCGGL
jgi:FlaG/FlaF family flagellin (archaellin)